jgi:hypothetical protein
MAEPSTFPDEHAVAPLVYRRISGFAIAGLIAGLLSAICVLVAGAAAFFARTPLLLPAPVLALFFVGAGLSLAALMLISRSEGVLAGTRLAVTGLLISGVFGLGYLAYYGAIYFALKEQADRFTVNWLNLIKNNKLDHAFLETHPPEQRAGINPDNLQELKIRFNQRPLAAPGPRERRGLLDMFRRHKFVHTLVQGGPSATIEGLGVKNWEYTNGGYKVTRIYRVTTPEGIFQVSIPVKGSESKTHEYEGRQWYVEANDLQVVKIEPTELGVAVHSLDSLSHRFAQEWANKLVAGDLTNAYLDTLPYPERRPLRTKYHHLRMVSLATEALPNGIGPMALVPNLAGAVLLNGDLTRELYLPGYAEAFRDTKILRTEHIEPDEASQLPAIRKALRSMLAGTAEVSELNQVKVEPSSAEHTFSYEGQQLTMPHDCKLGFITAAGENFLCEGTIFVQSDAGTLDPARGINWRILRVDMGEAYDPSKSQMSPPGGAPTRAKSPPAPRVGPEGNILP